MAGVHWNEKNLPNPETTSGAQAKANQALADAKTYTDSKTSAIPWGNVTGKPSTFPPSSHTHSWSEITGAPATATRWPSWSEVTSKPSTFPPSGHNHDDRYYTKSQIDNLVAGATQTYATPGTNITAAESLAEAHQSFQGSNSVSTTNVKVFIVPKLGGYRLSLQLRRQGEVGAARAFFVYDGIELGEVFTTSTSYTTLTYDIPLLGAGGAVGIRLRPGSGEVSGRVYIRNVYVMYNETTTPPSQGFGYPA